MNCPKCKKKSNQLMYGEIMEKAYLACPKCGNFWSTVIRR